MSTCIAQGLNFLKKFDWINTSFLFLTHVMGILGALYLIDGCLTHIVVATFHWQTILLGVLLYTGRGLSITAGYHRLYAHRTYKCHKLTQLVILILGAWSGQNEAKKWAADHRVHHKETDGPKDPYSITKGFWWAHIGWVLMKDKEQDFSEPLFKDLASDRLLAWQSKYYALLVASGFVFVAGIAAFWKDPIGGLLFAGFTSLLLQYHAAFCINSVAHLLGVRPYDRKITAADHWLTSLITFGEGYHNYHHVFPRDYRNGIRWWQYDPTKWFIWLLKKIKLAWDLTEMPMEKIRKMRARASLGTNSASF